MGTIFWLALVIIKILFLMQPQWMAPEVLRNEPSNEKSASYLSLFLQKVKVVKITIFKLID